MSNFKEFCQLHNHSVYSLLDAIPTPYEWVSWCLENNCPGFAITDHGTAISLYDAVRFPELIRKYNKEHGTTYAENAVIGVPGVELYVKLHKDDDSHHHITCWAVSNQGYYNLMKLSSVAYEDTVTYYGSVKGRVTFDQILEYKEGLKFGTGCIAGPIGRAIIDNKRDLAEERFLKYKEMFGDNLYIEFHPTDVTHQFVKDKEKSSFQPIAPNECSCDGNIQKGYNIFLMEMMEKYGGKAIPVTDAHFIYPEDKVIQDLVLKNGNENGWYFRECFESSMMVDMADGSKKKICEIKSGDYVKSYDFNSKRVISAKVNKAWSTPASREDFMFNKFHGPRSNQSITASTKNHLFYDGREWVEVKDIVKGCLLYSGISSLSKEVLDGCMLGDGGIHGQGSDGDVMTFQYGHAERQRGLTELVANILGTPVSAHKQHKDSYSKGKGVVVRTALRHPFISLERNRWYPHGIKVIPKDIEITPVVLAFWFMDDGYTNFNYSRKKGVKRITPIIQSRLYSCGFTDEDNLFLLEKLKLLGIDGTFRKYKSNKNNINKHGWLLFNKTNTEKLHAIIAPYITDDLQYKLLPQFRGKFNKDFVKKQEPFETIYPVAVRREIPEPPSSIKKLDLTRKWDLEIDEHHCFFVNSILVHNCYDQKKSAKVFSMLKTHLGDWLTEERFNEWIENSFEVMNLAKSINVKYDYHLPEIAVPDDIKARTEDYNHQTYLFMMEKISEHGRWKNDPLYIQRFKKEIDVIYKNKKLNFIPYFLLYEDICTFARKSDILQGIARGSAGGCLISYYLKITHIDPIKENLPFERFLSHERINNGSFPDIDADFGNREPIIKYLKDKYGLGFAQMGTFLRMKTKMAIKDAMFALRGKKHNDPEVQMLCDKIPDSPQGVDEHGFLYGYTDSEDVVHEGLIETNDHVKNFFKANPDIEQMVGRLLGVMRGWSRHASAYVLSTVDLAAGYVPTMTMADKKTGERITVTQYDAGMVEKNGLIKADILGVSTIQAVSDTVKLIKSRHNIDLLEEDSDGMQAIYRLPEDSKVYDDFYKQDTDSSFQFSTPLIKGYIKQFNPRNRNHLSDLTALCRPGALDSPFSNADIAESDGVSAAQYYMDVRSGERELRYLHDDLMAHTVNGIFVYQENIMSFLVGICGYTPERADTVRAAIGKKKRDVILKTFDDIRRVGVERGWTDEITEIICSQIEAFSKYSFNLSHSRAYAELGYITMWLKRNYPLEWWCAILNSVIDKEEKLRHYVSYLGNKIMPPSINQPSTVFSIVGKGIMAPVTVIKGVGEKAVQELTSKAPFASMDDYIKRVNHSKVNANVFAALVKGRAVDCFMTPGDGYMESRKQLVENYSKVRKCKDIVESVISTDPLSSFLMEREANTVFNKTLLSDKNIFVSILSRWGGSISITSDKKKPMTFASSWADNGTEILANLQVAQEIIDAEDTQKYGMWLLCLGSSYTDGVTKHGKKYQKLSIMLTDGYNDCEGVWWDKTNPLRYPKNTLVYVEGKFKKGWKLPISITISDLTSFEEMGEKYHV